MALEVRRATRSKSKARILIHGPSGSGKTYSSLLLAFGLGDKVAMIDTESGSGDAYSHLGVYDIAQMRPPYDTDALVSGIKQLEKDYDVIIVDSLSAWWIGEGGLLDLQERITEGSSSKNSYAAYRKITPRYQRVIDTIIGSKSHVIVTARSKQDYQQVEENGKKKVVKLGMSPQIRPDSDFEFGLAFALVHGSNIATTDKDRMGLFPSDNPFKITKDTGKLIKDWLNSGADSTDKDIAPALPLAQAPVELETCSVCAPNEQSTSISQPVDAPKKEGKINWGKMNVAMKETSKAIGQEITDEDVRDFGKVTFNKDSRKEWTLDEFDVAMKWMRAMWQTKKFMATYQE